MDLKKLIRFCIDWKGNDIRYEETLEKETVEAIHSHIERAERKLFEYILANHDYGAIPETGDYANGWNDSRKRSRQQVEFLGAKYLKKGEKGKWQI